MGAIKVTSADSAFSKCVRERAAWKCERCGAQHLPGSQGLHCSHFISRGNWSVRLDPLNATSVCYGCHSWLGGRPNDHRAWVESLRGDVVMEILTEKARDTSLGRLARKGVREIAAHYRHELIRMRALRDAGHEGRIEFVGWA